LSPCEPSKEGRFTKGGEKVFVEDPEVGDVVESDKAGDPDENGETKVLNIRVRVRFPAFSPPAVEQRPRDGVSSRLVPLQKKSPNSSTRIRAMPPTTPPAIAPTFVVFFLVSTELGEFGDDMGLMVELLEESATVV